MSFKQRILSRKFLLTLGSFLTFVATEQYELALGAVLGFLGVEGYADAKTRK